MIFQLWDGHEINFTTQSFKRHKTHQCWCRFSPMYVVWTLVVQGLSNCRIQKRKIPKQITPPRHTQKSPNKSENDDDVRSCVWSSGVPFTGDLYKPTENSRLRIAELHTSESASLRLPTTTSTFCCGNKGTLHLHTLTFTLRQPYCVCVHNERLPNYLKTV